MQPTPATRKQLILSPEARAALKLPLAVNSLYLVDADGRGIADFYDNDHNYSVNKELAAFIADLVNAALIPAEPVTVEPETEAELRQATDGTGYAWS